MCVGFASGVALPQHAPAAAAARTVRDGAAARPRAPRPLSAATSKRARPPFTRTAVAACADASPEEEEDGGEEPIDFFGAPRDAALPDEAPPVVPAFGSFSELPLFPLSLVLNPGSSIPLHIFEMRYRLMFNRIRDGDSRFGIVFYDKDRDALAAVGCSAELSRFEPMPDGSGRIMTNSIARSRFRIVNILEDKPYKRALVEYFSDDDVEEADRPELSALENGVWAALQDVLRLSNKLYDKSLDLGTNLRELAPPGDAARGGGGGDDVRRAQDFSFAISQVLDMPLEQQQLLLQTRSTLRRLRKQSKILDTARQYLAAQVTIKGAGLKF
jgi:ATP-dependent Lon protease